MIIAFLAGLGFLFSWVGLAILLVYFVIVSALFEDDWWFKGFLFLAIPIGLFYGIHYATMGTLVLPTWTQAAYTVGGYLGIGFLWSFFRWMIFVTDLKKLILKVKAKMYDILVATGIGTGRTVDPTPTEWSALTDGKKGDILWNAFYMNRDYSGNKFYYFFDKNEVEDNLKIIPSVSSWESKGYVFSWVVYWPFSSLNYAYNRLLKDLVDFIIERFKGIYNLIATYIMKGITA